MIKLLVALLAVVPIGFTVACSSGDSVQYIDEFAPDSGSDATWDFPGDGSLRDLVRDSDAIGVFDVLAIRSVEEQPVGTTGFSSYYTTYEVEVTQWIRAAEEPVTLIIQIGRVDPIGGLPDVIDGDFLLEVGHSYVLLLEEKPSSVPGPATYWRRGGGRGGFQVTDGQVHVLNHPIAQEISGAYNGLDVTQFIDELVQFATLPPLEDQPTGPLPTDDQSDNRSEPEPPTSEGSVERVTIDVKVESDTANRANAAGSTESCTTITSSPVMAGLSTGNNTSTTLNDSGQTFPSTLTDAAVLIKSGTGSGQIRRIVAVGDSQLTVEPPWAVIPDATSSYEIRGTLPIDILVEGVPPFQSSTYRGGLQSVGFLLELNPGALSVVAVNPGGDANLMLAAAGPRIPFDLVDADALQGGNNDPLPGTSGVMRVDLSDLSERFEDGSGILARLLVAPLATGVAPLIIKPEVVDASATAYTVLENRPATLMVDLPC